MEQQQKKQVLAIGAVAALIVFGIMFLQMNSDRDADKRSENNLTNLASNQSGEQRPDNTIVFTGSEFRPSTLTVNASEQVTWVNRGYTSMWIASDQHPTHTEYDGTTLSEHCGPGRKTFDQCETGERFTFTFNQTGTYGYHNHRPFVPGGKVVVQ